ncbi:hypothetical protein HBH70_245370 [Parastagonospora nodorum]|nr:hypothetical protein HBH70_245370 [Parastagonospora nodorum]
MLLTSSTASALVASLLPSAASWTPSALMFKGRDCKTVYKRNCKSWRVRKTASP